jgi:hypothetical protein
MEDAMIDETQGPIVGPLPPAKDERSAAGDAANRLKSALLGVDAGWYDAYWCRQQLDAKLGLPHGVVRHLLDAITGLMRRKSALSVNRPASDLLVVDIHFGME